MDVAWGDVFDASRVDIGSIGCNVLYQQLCHCVALLPECYELDNWERFFLIVNWLSRKLHHDPLEILFSSIPSSPPKIENTHQYAHHQLPPTLPTFTNQRYNHQPYHPRQKNRRTERFPLNIYGQLVQLFPWFGCFMLLHPLHMFTSFWHHFVSLFFYLFFCTDSFFSNIQLFRFHGFCPRTSRPLSRVWVWMKCTAWLEAWIGDQLPRGVDRLNTFPKGMKAKKTELDII